MTGGNNVEKYISLVITTLLSGVVGLILYIWSGSRRDDAAKMNKVERCLENHNDRILVLETEHKNNTCKSKRK